MSRKLLTVALLGLAAPITSHVVAQTPSPPPSQAAHYSVNETLVGTLLDDPASTAILKRLIPTVYANDMFHTMGRTQTLKAIQQYAPDELSDEVLALIQAEFDKLRG